VKIPGAKLAMFSAEELGGYFMFWENPAKFKAVVREFPRVRARIRRRPSARRHTVSRNSSA
jgi:hypothetical protein